MTLGPKARSTRISAWILLAALLLPGVGRAEELVLCIDFGGHKRVETALSSWCSAVSSSGPKQVDATREDHDCCSRLHLSITGPSLTPDPEPSIKPDKQTLLTSEAVISTTTQRVTQELLVVPDDGGLALTSLVRNVVLLI